MYFAYYMFCNCPSIGDESKSSDTWNNDSPSYDDYIYISAKPNPASTWTAFDYELPIGISSGILDISDVSGRVIKSFILDQQQGQQLWDIRGMDPGIYIYTFKVVNTTKSGKLIIK